MAWDFSTEPEFEEKLAWMREFVREEIWPIETIGDEITQAQLDAIYAPLHRRSRSRGCGRRTCRPTSAGRASVRSSWA